MKRNIPYLLIVCLLVLAGNACRKTKGPGEDPKPLAGSVAVQVTLPAGASFDFTGSQLLSFGSSYPVSKSGATMAQDFDDAPHIAYMIDKNNQLILAGFITDSTTSLSPATTAKVLLYFACGIHYRPDTMTNIFINRIYELPQATAWADEFTSLWKNDPQVLAKGAFTAPLRKTMESMAGKGKTLDIGNLRTSDIVVDQGDFLSGIQLFQENLGALTFRNNYRRRAHAFLYKMKRKLENGQEQVIISDINSGTKADKDLAIDPASANTSITGQIGTMIQPDNKADEIFSVKSGPVVLDLSDSESEVTWKVRVVGPGVPFSKQPTTNAEIAKQTRLEIETFAIDFMFPLIMETAGWRKELGKVGIDIGNGPVDKFIDATDVFLKVVPDAYEQVKRVNTYRPCAVR
ncbi:hypothetical protein MKQ70_06815 [Chitinophaga sedimenti]|uniref:hypothetical protein n=1 Tax=Chitinophaga sedimenti TaxID=2033606 RepID=UPI002003F93B|nr:hypothetical protein [Chitinophaga sedimenti]MCK7554728.1 hypothetical protein [Chitinophaga sedimenti]